MVAVEPEAQCAAIAAKDSDVVVAVVGLTSELEGEEMAVSEEGFQGEGDRTSLDLPKDEEALIESHEGYRQAAGGGSDERQRAGSQLGEPDMPTPSWKPGTPAKRAARPSRKLWRA